MDDHCCRAVHKEHRGYVILGTQDDPGRDWYIQVTAPNGCFVYDGWWRNSAGKTTSEVIEEAKRGAGLCGNDAEKDAEIATESVAPIPEREPPVGGSILRAKGMETPTPD